MKIISSELYVKDNKVYHEGNKPKPKDIGAAPETHTHNYASATTPGGSAEHAIKATEDSLGQRIDKYIKGLSVSGRTITYTRGDGTTGTITTQDNDTKVTNTLNTTAKAYITGTTESATNTGTQVFDTNVYLDTTAGMLTATTFKGALQGNAATATSATSATSATKLATARTINGTSFDGTGNITTANWGTARNIQIGNSSKSVNGSANVSWSIGEIGAAPASHNHTSLSGITNLSFAAEGTDSASITTTVDGPNTYFDFNLSDDPSQNDMWRWRFRPAGANVFNAMTLDAISTTEAKLAVTGEVQAARLKGTLTGDVKGNVTGTVSGNAGSATKLATARTINGTNFDGSTNITTANWGTARNIQIGNAVKSVNGSGNVSWTLAEIGALPLSGGTVTGSTVFQQGTRVHNGIGTNGSSGYVKIAQLKITGNYQNQPIYFLVSQRGRDLSTLEVYFSNTNGPDPVLSKFYKTGGIVAYLHKSATSVWDLYIQKSEGYDNIDILDFRKGSYMNGTTITWTNVHADALPSGATAATSKEDRYIKGNNILLSVESDILNSSALTTSRKQLIAGSTDKVYAGNTSANLILESSSTPQVRMNNNFYPIYHTGNKPTASEIGAAATSHTHNYAPVENGVQRWNSVIKCATWSRIMYLSGHNVIGHSGIINIQGTRGNVVFNATFIINTSHPSKAYITQINNTNYSNFQIRAVTNNESDTYIEVYDNVNGATNATTQTLNVSYTAISGVGAGTLTKYTAFTDGTTIPTNFVEAHKITTVSGSHYSGNASTATKLQTARSINGTNFDGSGNITTANWGTARNIQIGNTSKSVNGGGNVSWSLSEIGAAPTSHNHTSLNGVTSIGFSADGSDNASIRTTISGAATYLDMYLTDDAGQDRFRWRFKPYSSDTSQAVERSLMELYPTSANQKSARLLVDGEVVATSENGLRVVSGNYGFFIRNDGSNTYFMFTNSGDQYGNWNSLRPICINNSNGLVTFGNGLSGSLSGNASTATKLQTARTIALGGILSGSASFDGSGNVIINATANDITTITKSLNVTTSWADTGITGSNLATGTWTLGDIGAAAANHTHGLINLNSEAFSGGNDLNTYNSAKTWVARTLNSTTNKPGDYFTVVNFGASSNSNFQLAHSYANSSILYVRGRHDTSGNYTPWAKIYTDKNKPTVSEIGAEIGAAPASSTSLKTTDKTIVGAINEVFQSGNSVKQNLVDTLIAKGAEDISTSNSWDSLIDIIEGSNINLAPISFTVEPIPNAQYGFRLLGSGPYYESENFGVHNSYAMCKLNIVCNSNYNVYLDCINYAENNYDYGIISQINTPLSFSYQTDPNGVLKSFKGLSSPEVQTVQLKSESGYYYIKYVKDSTASQGNDSIRFKVRFEKKTGGNPGVPGNPGGEETILFSSTIGGDNRSLTGGYTHKRQTSGSYFMYDASCMDFMAQYNGRGGSTLETVISENRINLTNYSRLRIKGYFTTTTNDSGGAPLVGFDAIGNRDDAFAASIAITSSGQRYYDLDISGLTGNYHLKFNVATSLQKPSTGEIIKHLYITELILYP